MTKGIAGTSQQRDRIPCGAQCSNCGHHFDHPDNLNFVFCLDLDRWQPADFVCQRYTPEGERSLAQIFGPVELGLQIEAGLE